MEFADTQSSGYLSRKTGLWIMALITLLVIAANCLLPRIPQPLSYHQFADHRVLLGIPNFDDVISNLPFAIFGIWGLIYLLRLSREEIAQRFLDPKERIPYLFVFIGLILTAFGSSYYHLHPNNSTLVWDRLPMTIDFMSLVSALFIERIDKRIGFRLFPILLLIGMASVIQWHLSEVHGIGDLRFYATVQAYSVLFLLMTLMLPPRYTCGKYLILIAGFYVMAKLLETYDKILFNLFGHEISGHTLKHIAAAFAGYWILKILKERRPIMSYESEIKA